MDAPVAVLKFFVDQALVHSVTVTLPVSVGRRDASRGEAAPVSVTADRVVIADETEVSIPRRWFRIDTDAGGELVLENIHSVSAVFLDGGATISSGCRRALRNEATVLLGNKSAVRITIDEAGRGSDDHGYSSLSSLPTVPGRPAETELSSILAFDNQQSTELVEVLQAALQVVNEAAGSPRSSHVVFSRDLR